MCSSVHPISSALSFGEALSQFCELAGLRCWGAPAIPGTPEDPQVQLRVGAAVFAASTGSALQGRTLTPLGGCTDGKWHQLCGKPCV